MLANRLQDRLRQAPWIAAGVSPSATAISRARACGRHSSMPSGQSNASTAISRARACGRAEGHLGHFVTLGDSFFATDRGSPSGSPSPRCRHVEKEPRRTVPLGLHGGHSVFNGSPSSSLPSPVQTPRRTRATMASHRCHWRQFQTRFDQFWTSFGRSNSYFSASFLRFAARR